MKVFLSPCETHDRAWTNQYHSLVKLSEVAVPQRHTLVDSPDNADIIIISDLRHEDRFASLRANPLVRRFPRKTFVYSDEDEPIAFVPGVYTSMPRSALNLGRIEGAMYLTEVSEWNNPFLAEPVARDPDLLFSFVGRDSAPVRARLLAQRFSRPDVLVEDTSLAYQHWDHGTPDRAAFQRTYVETCARSRFVVCPRGAGTSSIRLFEVMQMGIAPIILSDRWIRPSGPQWDDFAIIVPENDIDQLESIAAAHEDRWDEMGRLARQNWTRWFSREKQFNYVVERIEVIQRQSKIDERLVQRLWLPTVAALRARNLARRVTSRVRTQQGPTAD